VHRAVSLLAFVLSLLSISCGKDDQALDRLPGRQGFLRLSDADRRAFSAFNAGKAAQIFARTSPVKEHIRAVQDTAAAQPRRVSGR